MLALSKRHQINTATALCAVPGTSAERWIYLGTDVLTSRSSLFVRNHLAAWPESCLGKRRQCLAAASSASESEIPPPSQALETQVSLTHCILQLLPTPNTFSHQEPGRYRQGKPLQSEQRGASASPLARAAQQPQDGDTRGQEGTKSVSCHQKKVRADTTPQ